MHDIISKKKQYLCFIKQLDDGFTSIKTINVMKTQKISISDFSFSFSGYGHYKVTYTSPATGKQWTITTNNMPLIDATKNADEPKRKDLEDLRRMCKY